VARLQALSRGRIVFSHSPFCECTQAVYDALALRRLLFIEESNHEVLQEFEAGTHLVTYTETNLLERIEYYLQHVDEREDIALSGHREVLSHHTALDKARALVDILGQSSMWRLRGGHELDHTKLHGNAARVFLNHGQLRLALSHSNAAFVKANTQQDRLTRARVLGVEVLQSKNKVQLVDAFQLASEEATAAYPNATWLRWNHLEVGHALAKLEPEPLREFIDALQTGKLTFDQGDGPLPVIMDSLRLCWQETLAGAFEPTAQTHETWKSALLARAFQLLGDLESQRGRLHDALEAYQQSLRVWKDGSLEHRLGLLQFQLGQLDHALATLERATRSEPFFFEARKDLFHLQSISGNPKKARSTAIETLQMLGGLKSPLEDAITDLLLRTSVQTYSTTLLYDSTILWEEGTNHSPCAQDDRKALLHELLRRDLPITVEGCSCVASTERSTGLPEHDRLISAMKRPIKEPFVQIGCGWAESFQRRQGASISIWRPNLPLDLSKASGNSLPPPDSIDQIWVSSNFDRDFLLARGVPGTRIVIIPEPLDLLHFQRESIEMDLPARFNFLSIFHWDRGAGWDLLIEALLSEFAKSEEVGLICYVLASPGIVQVEVRDAMRRFIRNDLRLNPDQIPKIQVIDVALRPGELRSLYSMVDAFVLPSRSPISGLPYLEALTAALPTIGTRWGRQLDFLSDENGYLVNNDGLEQAPPGKYQSTGNEWARPSLENLRRIMRRVYEDPEEGRLKARRSLPQLIAKYHLHNVANQVVDNINDLLR
jgi:glycosyltransferase involved in cell wall biosynthesis/tetratricopeptide (TPR) repeat protein